MARVKIKTINAREPRKKKKKILEIFSSNDVYVTSIIPANDGFVVLTSSDTELDKIFNNHTDKQLEDYEIYPQIPPHLRENWSTLMFRVDRLIYDNTEADSKEEMITQNDWIGQISKVHKFLRGNTVKVKLQETSNANQSTWNWIKIILNGNLKKRYSPSYLY